MTRENGERDFPRQTGSQICSRDYAFHSTGDKKMKRIALACDDHFGIESSLSSHFGKCPYYILVDVLKDHILGFQLIKNPYFQNHQPGVIPHFINSHKADVMIAGGIGPRAIDLFRECDIEVVSGVQGKVGDVLEAYLRGEVRGVVACEHEDHKCEK